MAVKKNAAADAAKVEKKVEAVKETAAEKKEYYQNSCDILGRYYNMLYLYCTCE